MITHAYMKRLHGKGNDKIRTREGSAATEALYTYVGMPVFLYVNFQKRKTEAFLHLLNPTDLLVYKEKWWGVRGCDPIGSHSEEKN